MYNQSSRQKAKEYPIHYANQKGLCLFCSKEFNEYFTPEVDHLNNNKHDNRIENHALVCHSCNNLKKSNAEMQVIASEKLKENEKRVYACERILADSGTIEDLTSSQAINKTNTRITKQFLSEHTINNQILILKDAVNAITNICQDNNGTGSQSAIYKTIDYLTNTINGKYTICLNEFGKNVIKRRTEN